MNMQKIIRLINPIKRSISLIIGKGKVNFSKSHDKVQASFMENEDLEDVPVLHMYGLASVIPKDSKCVAICNGRRKNLMIFAVDSKPPVNLSEDEVLLWNKAGNQVHLKNDKVIIKSGDENLGTIIESLISAMEVNCKDGKPILNPVQATKLKTAIGRFK